MGKGLGLTFLFFGGFVGQKEILEEGGLGEGELFSLVTLGHCGRRTEGYRAYHGYFRIEG